MYIIQTNFMPIAAIDTLGGLCLLALSQGRNHVSMSPPRLCWTPQDLDT